MDYSKYRQKYINFIDDYGYDDTKFKDIRGNAANFTEAFAKTMEILNIKKNKGTVE